MKFLIITESRIGKSVPKPDHPQATFKAAHEWNAARLKDGSFDYVYGFSDGRGGITIVNANSHEELLLLIRSSPMYRFMDYEIRPLCDLQVLWEQQIAGAGIHNQG